MCVIRGGRLCKCFDELKCPKNVDSAIIERKSHKLIIMKRVKKDEMAKGLSQLYRTVIKASGMRYSRKGNKRD